MKNSSNKKTDKRVERLNKKIESQEKIIKELKQESKQLKLQEQLKENESLFWQVINNSPNCIFVKDREGRYILVNQQMADMHKTTPEALVGLTDMSIAKKWLTSVAEIKEFRASELEVIDKKQIRFIPEEEFTYQDGTKRWFQTTKSPIKWKNKQDYLLTIAVDITERKQAEAALKESNENFQQVVSNITTVVWKADIGKNGAFENTYSSPVVDKLLELPAGTIQNDWDKYFKYIKPEYIERVNNAFREAIISPGKEIDCEYEVLKDNRQTAWFQSKGRCFEKNGKLHVFGSTTDITQRKKAEAELRERVNELEVFYHAAVGREGRVIELKQEVNKLLDQFGKKKKYGDYSK
ncbi:PAS domain-containing protein [Candidatus Dependentiae bacterium]|nr:PAS domain-containing protein [Candidatus Dependentiae bacterium]